MTPAQYEPGVVQVLFQPLGVADLFGTSTTSASQVRYVNETSVTNAAAGVAEAGVKPESSIAVAEVTEPIKKLATTTVVSDELLEDAPSVSSYLNQRLTLFVQIEEERQLLRGSGTNELNGLFNRGISTFARGTFTNSEAILRAASGARGSSFLEPSALILHPLTGWPRGSKETPRDSSWEEVLGRASTATAPRSALRPSRRLRSGGCP